MRKIITALVLTLSACGGTQMMTGGPDGGGGGADSGGSSDGGGGGSCPPYMVPPGTNLTTPVVSFKNDVMRVFNNSCDLVACHGTQTNPQGGLFLGAEAAMRADAAMVHAGIVGKASAELPSMPFITAGDPSKSYLMHKMDGDQCAFDNQCVNKSCQALMPSGGSQVLPVAIRDTVRRWIAQGAANN